MYGMAGNQYAGLVRVSRVSDIADLVKEAQVQGKKARTFFTASQKELKVSFDGMFLVNVSSGELMDECELERSVEANIFFTKAM